MRGGTRFALAGLFLLAACAPDEPAFVEGEIGVFRAGLTVGEAGGCSTAIVAGLTAQLIAETNCLRPNALVPFGGPGISIGKAVNAHLEPPAAAALAAAVKRHGGTIIINSALRSLAQQYLLYKWQGSCGIQIAARPGHSNHETGLALDVGNYDSFRSALEAEGFDWYGSGDRVHYDYRGPGAVDLRATSVLAFQRLWNVNHPGDPIDEDGIYGPMTEARLAQSPAGGFPVGSTCEEDDPPPPPPPVEAPFAAELVSVESPAALEAGQLGEVRVTFRNTGTATWTPARTRLGTTGPHDRESLLAAPSWLAPNRPAHVEAETPPGGLGRFVFAIHAPEVAAPQAFDEDFGLVEEAVTWFGPEMGVAFSVEVSPPLPPAGGCALAPAGRGPAPLGLLLAAALLGALAARRRRRIRRSPDGHALDGAAHDLDP